MKKFYSFLTFIALIFSSTIFSQDLAITFIGPQGNGCLGSNETISATISNLLGVPYAGSFTASYSLNGGPFVTQDAGPLVMLGSTTYILDFLTPADFSQCQTHELVISVYIAGDINTLNDTLTIDIINDCPLNFTTLGADPTLSGTDGVAYCTVTGGTPTYTYLWTNQTTLATSNSNIWTGLTPAIYDITVTDINGCAADSTVEVLMAYLALQNNMLEETTVSFSNNLLTVQMSKENPTATCLIYDVSGKCIQTISITDAKTFIELNLPSSVYLYQIVNQDFSSISTGKFVVN